VRQDAQKTPFFDLFKLALFTNMYAPKYNKKKVKVKKRPKNPKNDHFNHVLKTLCSVEKRGKKKFFFFFVKVTFFCRFLKICTRLSSTKLTKNSPSWRTS